MVYKCFDKKTFNTNKGPRVSSENKELFGELKKNYKKN